jgi:hypothetical protein
MDSDIGITYLQTGCSVMYEGISCEVKLIIHGTDEKIWVISFKLIIHIWKLGLTSFIGLFREVYGS